MKKALVCGAGGFIGSHMVTRLVEEGFFVKGVDLKYPEFSETVADEFYVGDLSDKQFCLSVFEDGIDEVYQFAADMGGAGYIFTGDNDARVMQNSASINLNVLEAARLKSSKKIFFSSSACIYPEDNQRQTTSPITSEESAYPANPDSDLAGKSCSVRGYTKHIAEIMGCGYVLLATITYSAHLELGKAARKRPLPHFAEKSLRRHLAVR